jgi:hypothetical protein
MPDTNTILLYFDQGLAISHDGEVIRTSLELLDFTADLLILCRAWRWSG